ncbi:hypothetical protein CAI21_04530 [Alkalilimnicola ehrlichii]|uniref:CmpA/NrtA family ABC transporter substrate-binding protein n=1 Tax=Alkalilimnicola ehrlichii TaxID=351052 RepID=UPI000E2F74BB|nr:CmpA/NrtA family ABC transporter substrate-binding protein [Alkalilimnicola ehrlichii]RFA30777.1 hypothetical protein CAI21_04530 [Alkalilimnicola ehrlichii]
MSHALEKTALRVGFISLTDCAPLAVAKEQGFFAAEGLDVTLCRETSWANIRDKVMLGALDAAQMPAPMPLAATLGVAGPRVPMITPCVLNLGGNAITVSHDLFRQMLALAPEALREPPYTADALRAVIEARRILDKPPLVFATVFPTSTHYYQLCYWLSAAGIDPLRDLTLKVISPPHMVRALEMDEIAGFCVGEPWNGLAVDLGLGVSLISSYEIWNNAMEKVLAMTEAWHLRHPQTTLALTRAVVRACRWLEKPRHRELAAILLSRADYVDVPQQVLEPALMGVRPHRPGEHGIPQPEFLVFGRSAANFPWRSQGLWYGEQMRIRGQLPPNVDVSAVVERSYRPDVFREAVAEIDMPVPTIDYKAEGVQHHAWTLQEATAPIAMGPNAFFTGERFDPVREAVHQQPAGRVH